MSATEMIYKIIDEKCLKQSAVARAAGYDPKKFNALGVTPNELFGVDR